MRFMPREWVEAQGFVWADAILATALLALAALSYVMLAHMLRSWGDGPQNASMTGARASPTDGGHDPASAAGNGRSASCAEYGPVKGEIEGMTALMRASSQGDEACAIELIAAGAQIDARDSQEGFTALLMASAMGAPAPARPHPPCAALACLARDRHGPPLPVTGGTPPWLVGAAEAAQGNSTLGLVFGPMRTDPLRCARCVRRARGGGAPPGDGQCRRRCREQRRGDGPDAGHVRTKGTRCAFPAGTRRAAGAGGGARVC